ncbi:unnamed protein product [Mytilus coruscus]|uniref:Uncharacterized protein n=1 Tax=Mytilus coruscus TaxID=42192 RepID=A0A6J8CJE9_MYTCO|nr:unnamed protein product [Mytilus coruscus]
MANKNRQEVQKTDVSNSGESGYCTLSYAEKKVEAIYEFVKSPTNKLYMLFLNYAVHVFDDILKNLQTEEPMIHLLRKALNKLLRNVLTRFVKPSAFAMAQTVDSVDYKSSYNQKTDQELVIGEDAREGRLKKFYVTVRRYFVSCCDYMIAKLPLKDELLRPAEAVDVACQQTSKSSSLTYFLERFPTLLPKGVTNDVIVEQFISYQSYDIQDYIKKRIDETWLSIGQLKDEVGNCLFYI